MSCTFVACGLLFGFWTVKKRHTNGKGFLMVGIWQTSQNIIHSIHSECLLIFFLWLLFASSSHLVLVFMSLFILTIIIFIFLVADTQLYKRLCPSVCPLVGRLVGPWKRVKKWGNERFKTFLVADSCISAPAHPSATDGRVSGLVIALCSFN